MERARSTRETSSGNYKLLTDQLGSRLEELIRGNHEILTENGNLNRAPDPDQVIHRSGEVPLLSQHRNGGRTASLVLHGECSRIGDLS